jgi:3-deoxy-manno-octulosonate cytidylyltransferase (CMP-KDO synthetase)
MIIIPARLNSSRFPNKILADIMGLPMVIRTARQVSSLDRVVIATDCSEVMDLAQEYGFEAIMTSIEHNSGTDRINEAVNNLDIKDDEIIVNVQADEPFIELEVVQAVINRAKEVKKCPNTLITSCYKEISNISANDPNLVKVVLNNLEEAIYFSRSKIPFHRDGDENSSYFGHIGIYAFTKNSLNIFCNLNSSKLENIEKLEQLRAIDNGYKIAMVKVNSKSFGIDTKDDLEKALEVFKDEK